MFSLSTAYYTNSFFSIREKIMVYKVHKFFYSVEWVLVRKRCNLVNFDKFRGKVHKLSKMLLAWWVMKHAYIQ
jgi:hypothetical protein